MRQDRIVSTVLDFDVPIRSVMCEQRRHGMRTNRRKFFETVSAGAAGLTVGAAAAAEAQTQTQARTQARRAPRIQDGG